MINLVKHINLPLALLMSITVASSSCAAATTTTSYSNSSENFPNPERGFSIDSLSVNQDNPLWIPTLQQARSNKITLVRRLYRIPQFRNSALSQSFLDFVARDCQTARQVGVKLVVRFSYNGDASGYDASKDRILSHLDQLKPILAANQDVIAYMEAGFIGAWGEWHSSSSGLDNSQDRRTILSKILSVLPNQRMVAVRTPNFKMDAYNNSNPLTAQEAFNGTYRARTGGHNDCFVANADDAGTYDSNSSTVIENLKNFLNVDNQYVPQGGETCAPSSYAACPNTLKELARMRWSALNVDYHPTVIQGWTTQGCMGEIQRRLGYRFRLVNSAMPQSVKPAGTFSMNFQIVNDGWASPYNPRSLEVILRNRQTGTKYYLLVNEDLRRIKPGATKVVNVVGGIPATMPAGEYQALLNLPDVTSSLRNRPEYSIRLANQNVWEASTGYNSLLRNVTVSANAGGSNYSGNQFFTVR